MIIKSLTLAVLVFSSQNLLAENHLLIFGGGGEPQGNTTIFDNGMNNLGKSLEKTKWKYEVSFNGGHKNTEQVLRERYSAPSAPTTNFTQENYLSLIESYKNKILNGQIKAGDQLMIIVNTHGAAQSKGQLTHKIATSGGAATDLNQLSGSKLVSVDSLQELVQLTNERGINLGIIDLSCHSGNTLALKNNAPHTCIVTASGPVHYGFAGSVAFTDKFLGTLKPGMNLEEAFLKARLDSNDSAYPMISTSENDQIVNDVYESITPYLYYYSPKADKMTPYVLENSNLEQLCKRDEDFKKLISKIDNLKSVMKSKKNSFNADKLKELLLEYKKSQDKVLYNSMAIGAYKLEENVETFQIPANSGAALASHKVKYTWKELLELDVEKNVATYEKFKNFTTSERGKKDNQAVIDFLRKVDTKKQQIFSQNPRLKNYKEETANLVKQMDNSRAMANKIALQEKKFYEELYRRKQTINPNDPCRKIVF